MLVRVAKAIRGVKRDSAKDKARRILRLLRLRRRDKQVVRATQDRAEIPVTSLQSRFHAPFRGLIQTMSLVPGRVRVLRGGSWPQGRRSMIDDPKSLNSNYFWIGGPVEPSRYPSDLLRSIPFYRFSRDAKGLGSYIINSFASSWEALNIPRATESLSWPEIKSYADDIAKS